MDENPPHQGDLTVGFSGIGRVTREMVQARTRELVLTSGREPLQVKQADYEQAKRELTGESDRDRQEAVLDSIPKARQGDPPPGPLSGVSGFPGRISQQGYTP
jgi:hypothetical protein